MNSFNTFESVLIFKMKIKWNIVSIFISLFIKSPFFLKSSLSFLIPAILFKSSTLLNLSFLY